MAKVGNLSRADKIGGNARVVFFCGGFSARYEERNGFSAGAVWEWMGSGERWRVETNFEGAVYSIECRMGIEREYRRGNQGWMVLSGDGRRYSRKPGTPFADGIADNRYDEANDSG